MRNLYLLRDMEKQSHFRGGKRSVRHLPTITEEGDRDETLLQKRLVKDEERREEITQLMKSSDKYHHSIRNKRDTECQELTKTKTVLFRHINSFTDDQRTLNEHLRTSKLETEQWKDMNTAKALFPDFFPRTAIQDTCEDGWWKARPTMEQVFSKQNNTDCSEKSELHHDANFQYWKIYQLSF